MKKIIFIIFVLLLCNIFFISKCKSNANTISFEEYLYTPKTEEDWETVKLNSNGNVTFKNKVILTKKGIPLNKNTAYTIDELKVLFYASGIEPREGCDPKDTYNNGQLGCYIDIPDKNE